MLLVLILSRMHIFYIDKLKGECQVNSGYMYPTYPMMENDDEDYDMMRPMIEKGGGCPLMKMMMGCPMMNPSMMMGQMSGYPGMQYMMNPMMMNYPMGGCPLAGGMPGPSMMQPMMDYKMEEKK